MDETLETTDQPLMFSAKEAAQKLGVSYRYLTTLRAEGGGPPWLYLGRRVIYPARALEAYLEEAAMQ